jgi:hypothetical protein
MSLLKPSLHTPFHIDFDWWEHNDRNWHVYLRSLLCPEHQQVLADVAEDAAIDWVNPRTGEVQPVNGVQHALMSHCALLPEFLDEHTMVVEAVFRVFLANGNQPMSAQQLAEKLNRPAQILLRTLAGPRVYRGLRPVDASTAALAPAAMPAAEA